jgi:hypothetical protein
VVSSTGDLEVSGSSVAIAVTGISSIQNDDGAGINIDGFNANEVVTIQNDGTITGNGVTSDGDGVDVDGIVNLTNTGVIQSLNSFSDVPGEASEGVTIGGGTITNSGAIEGDVAEGNANAVGRGLPWLESTPVARRNRSMPIA